MSKKIGPEENFWLPKQLDIIKMVQCHPIIFIRDIMMTPTEYKAAVTTAWEKIARDLRLPQKSCKLEWTSIRFRYAKLNNLIRYGKVSEEIIHMHPKTTKYLDGTLDFLDAYVYDICDEDIPSCVHKRFNRMFGITNKQIVTKEMVQALMKKRTQEEESNDELGKLHVQNLMNIVEDAVERSLREMTISNGQSTSAAAAAADAEADASQQEQRTAG